MTEKWKLTCLGEKEEYCYLFLSFFVDFGGLVEVYWAWLDFCTRPIGTSPVESSRGLSISACLLGWLLNMETPIGILYRFGVLGLFLIHLGYFRPKNNTSMEIQLNEFSLGFLAGGSRHWRCC